MTTPDDMIEMLVESHYAGADLRTKHMFRQQLQLLAELAKLEQRQETNMELPGTDHAHRGTVH